MRRSFARALSFPLVALATLGAALGCNAILGNEHGSPLDDVDADASVADAALPPADAEPPVVDATISIPDSAPAIDAGPCAAGEKSCFARCVSLSDPAYGCDSTTCSPCKTNRASSVCAGGRCAIGACDPGYGDCNQRPGDGCETDLSQPTHCGACNAVCQPAAPYCAPLGPSFGCSTNCTPDAPTLCGGQCVDLNTSESHCGDCNTPCPTVLNGRQTCAARTCHLTCDAGFHACGNACASDVDPATCGASCTPCAAPANATTTCSGGACGWTCNAGFHSCGGACVANDDVGSCGPTSCTPCPTGHATSTCTAGVCGFVCAAGFADCDKNPANACETNTQSDPNNCGVCAHVCPATPCSLGQCDVPDAGPDGAADATTD
jgi:hypothetical protein